MTHSPRRADARPLTDARPRVGAVVAALVLVLVAGGGARAGAAPGAGSEPAEPTITIQEMQGSQGPVTMVRLAGWPPGIVTVSTCAGDGAEPAVDCDVTRARTADIDAQGSGTAPLPAGAPGACPCVVRVNTNTNDVVRTLSIDTAGLPTVVPDAVPAIPVGAASAKDLVVVARVAEGDRSWEESALVSLGASGAQDLVIDLHNSGSVPMPTLTGSLTVRRAGAAGVTNPLPLIAPLAPGEVRVISVPLSFPPPSVGTFEVVGDIRGLDAPVLFATDSSDRPLPLGAFAAVGAAIVVVVVVRRRRRRARGGARRATREPLEKEPVAVP